MLRAWPKSLDFLVSARAWGPVHPPVRWYRQMRTPRHRAVRGPAPSHTGAVVEKNGTRVGVAPGLALLRSV